MIRISCENRLKYLAGGHVSAQNYSISEEFICLEVYISTGDKICVKLPASSYAKQKFCIGIRSRQRVNDKWGLRPRSVDIWLNMPLILVETFWALIIFEYTILGL